MIVARGIAAPDDGTYRFSVTLTGGRPWGFRLQGGYEFAQRIRVAKVKADSKAAKQGVRVGDLVMAVNGFETEALTLNDALKVLQDASVDNSTVRLELTRTNRSTPLTVIGTSCVTHTSSTTCDRNQQPHQLPEKPLDSGNHVDVENHVTMAAYTMHSIDRHHGHHDNQTEETTARLPAQEVSKLSLPSLNTCRQLAEDAGNATRLQQSMKTTIQLQMSAANRPQTPSPDRGRRRAATAAAESVLRGFRNLRNFWLSPKPSRKPIGPNTDEVVADQDIAAQHVIAGTAPQKPIDVVKLSSLPHVMEQLSPAEEVQLPVTVPRFTMDEFTKAFGPCRQAFSLPSSPLRKKRLSTTSISSSCAEAEAEAMDAAEVGSVTSASTTPNFQRKVSFRLTHKERDASEDRDSVGGDCISVSSASPVQQRSHMPHSARETLQLRVVNSALRPINESLPLDRTPMTSSEVTTARDPDSRFRQQQFKSPVDDLDSDLDSCNEGQGRTMRSTARIRLSVSPPVRNPDRRLKRREELACTEDTKDPLKLNTRQKIIQFDKFFSRKTAAQAAKQTSVNGNASNLRRASVSDSEQLFLPDDEDPTITLLSATRGPAEPEGRQPLTETADVQVRSNSALNDDMKTDTSANASEEDEDLTYQDWYRKVFSKLHKATRELDAANQRAIEEDSVNPRRPSITKTAENPNCVKDESPLTMVSQTVVSQNQDDDNNYSLNQFNIFSLPRGKASTPADNGGNSSILVKSMKSKSLDATVSKSAAPRTNQTHRAVQKFELDLSAKIAAQNNFINKNASFHQSPQLKERCRSVDEPCRIVKPEDTSLYNDAYWIKFAKDLERERQPTTFHTLNKTDLTKPDNVANEGNRVLKLSQKVVVAPHHYDTTPFAKSRPAPVSTNKPVKARAIYTFVANDDKEMPFCRGDVLGLIRRVDKNWYEARMGDRRGLVPVNYIELLSQKDDRLEFYEEESDKDIRVRALHNFTAKTREELCMRKGDILTLIKQVDDNWYEGRLNGRLGVFPINHVERINEPGCISQTASSIQDHTSPMPSDTDISQISFPLSSSTYRNHVAPDRFRHTVVVQSTSPRPVNSSTARHQQQPSKASDYSSKYPNKEQLFIAIGSNDEGDDQWTTDAVETDVDDRDSGRRSVSANSPRRVTFNVQLPLPPVPTESGQLADRGRHHQGFIPSNNRNTTTQTWRKVLYDYNPCHEDELALLEGDLVTVIRSFDDGWCVGMLNRTKKVGTFPGNYLS